MVHFLDSSFSTRAEELEPLFFRSGHYSTWMITDLCQMTSIPILFIEWIVKMRNYQFSKSKRSCCSCKKLKRPITRPRTANVVSPLFPSLGTPCNMAWEIVRKCGMHIYSRRTMCLLHSKLLWVFLQKYLSPTWVTKIFQVQVGERGQRLKLWLCKLKIKKFSVPFMAIRLLNCIQKR